MAAFLRFLHRTLFLINLCWIVLLLLSYFVVFVNHSKINYIGLLGLGYPLFLFVNTLRVENQRLNNRLSLIQKENGLMMIRPFVLAEYLIDVCLIESMNR